MKKTNFRFFKNTPLIDFQNTIHFKSNQERDTFFLEGGHYTELPVEDMDFNFIRDRSIIDLPVSYGDMRGVNYCTFKSEFENTRYYAYVISYEYYNDDITRVYLLIDGVMTYTQGNMLTQLTNLSIERQHLPLHEYDNHLWELKNNDDILKTTTKSYFHTDRILFDDLIVLISASVDLQADFGTVDAPKMYTSYGKKFDKITSPLNLYACDIDDFNKLMLKLKDYAWISQNIKSLQLIPRIFMEGNLTKMSFASTESLSGVDYLYRLGDAQGTNKQPLLNELQSKSYTMNELSLLFGLDPVQDKHLLRNEYATAELYNYSGGQFFVDLGQLNNEKGLAYAVDLITGYHTEIKIFIERYRSETGNYAIDGSYINDSLAFNEFDDVPMLIDNFNLSMSKSANQRALTESKLVSNRIGNVMDKNASLKDRFFNAASLVSNFSPTNLFGKFSDEHEYYRSQKAEQADLALETPSISQQMTGNSFNIANDMFGVHIKYSKPSTTELKKIKKYYKLFGFELNNQSASLERVDSMNLINYVQFSGSWSLPDADVALIEMMKAQFENGIRLWHNNGTPNPMTQDILQNVMVK